MILVPSEAKISVVFLSKISFFIYFVNFVQKLLNTKDQVSNEWFFTGKQASDFAQNQNPKFLKIIKVSLKF